MNRIVKSMSVTLAMNVLGYSGDTLIISQAEFRFPETHPGKQFTVKKVLVQSVEGLKKRIPETQPSISHLSAKQDLLGRDPLGRTVKASGYHSRLTKIRNKQSLPVYLSQKPEGRPLLMVPKSEGSDSGKYFLISNSPLIQTAQDLVALEQEEMQAIHNRYGALSPALHEKFGLLGENDSVDIEIHLKKYHPGFLDKNKATQEQMKANAQAWVNAKPLITSDALLHKYGIPSQNRRMMGSSSEMRGVLSLRTTGARAQELSRDGNVVTILEQPRIEVAAVPGPAPSPFEALIESAHNPTSAMAHYAYLTNVATMEGGLRSSYTNCTSPDIQPDDYDANQGFEPAHAEGTYHLLAAGTPWSEKYHFLGYNFSSIAGKIVDNVIDVISVSLIGNWHDATYPDARFVDRHAYIYPFPIFSLPTGNDGHAYTSEHKSYNALIVGNTQHYDNATFNVDFWACCGSSNQLVAQYKSQTANPSAIYGTQNDRELPYLVAPGYRPDPYWGFQNGCILDPQGYQGLWGPGGGTSFSAPVLAAMAANVLGSNYYYQYGYPEMVRAALLVTAENIDGGYWNPANSDQRDGAGTVSGANAVQFAGGTGDLITTFDPGPGNWNQPYEGGFDRDVYYEADFVYPPSVHQYFYRAPSTFPAGKHLRVVLTWNSSPGLNYSQNRLSDLELQVESNSNWHYSSSWNGNIEMVDIDPNDITPNAVYTISVKPMVFRKATDGPEYVNYSIAWTWVNDVAN